MHYYLQYETAKDHKVRFRFPVTGGRPLLFIAISAAVTHPPPQRMIVILSFLWNKGDRNAKLNILSKDNRTSHIYSLYGVAFNCVYVHR
jgi:hypothetical protein